MKSISRVLSAVCALLVVVAAAPVASAEGVYSAATDACQFGGEISPGASVSRRCTIQNNDSLDADFFLFVSQSSLQVFDSAGGPVTGADRATFIGFFRYSLSTERFVTTKNNNGLPDRDVARVPYPSYKSVCESRPLTSMTDISSSCRVGRIRASGTNFDSRSFEKKLTMLDDSDQTRFAGWYLNFSETIRACVGTNCPGNNHTLTDEL